MDSLPTQSSNVKEYTQFESMPHIFDSVTGMKLMRGVIAYGFTEPSPIQQKTIVEVALGKDIIAQARSGTGKTGAFAIGSLSRLDMDLEDVQVIIISHTHELALQTAHVVEELGKKMGVKVERCIGQHLSVLENMRNIKNDKRHVVVGTPGRLHDLLNRGVFNVSNIKTVILDEADKLLTGKFLDQTREILQVIDTGRSPKIDPLQICIFSATMCKEVVDLARNVMNDPTVILVPDEELTLECIDQYVLEFDQEDRRESFNMKVAYIIALNGVQIIPKGIIYVNSARSAEALRDRLNANGLTTDCVHGQLTPNERSSIVRDFRLGKIRILIATDLLARGFDVQQVKVVINFSIPQVINNNTAEIDEDKIAEYQHRIGRSGRFGRKGIAINIVSTRYERLCLKTIQEKYKTEIKPLPENISEVFC